MTGMGRRAQAPFQASVWDAILLGNSHIPNFSCPSRAVLTRKSPAQGALGFEDIPNCPLLVYRLLFTVTMD